MDQEQLILRAMVAETRHQKPLTPSEKYALGRTLEELLATPAGRPSRQSVATYHVSGRGKTRDKVAAALGMSGRQWDKLKAVQESGCEDLKRELDQHGKVDRVFRELTRRRRAEAVALQNQGKEFE